MDLIKLLDAILSDLHISIDENKRDTIMESFQDIFACAQTELQDVAALDFTEVCNFWAMNKSNEYAECGPIERYNPRETTTTSIK